MSALLINSGLAAAILCAHTLVGKVMITVLFRIKTTAKATPKTEVQKVLTSQFYLRACAAQLNESEYAPLFIAGLLFLDSKGIDAPYIATMAVAGQVRDATMSAAFRPEGAN